MSEEGRSEKIALLFEEAVEIATPTERAAFLANACAGDPELYREIATLLRAHESAGSFLGGTSLFEHGNRPEHAQASGVEPGDRLGPYQLLGRIGEGASSAVYLAEQEQPVRRWVALKVIKAGMDTRQVIARFELERQALAVMDHPGIAKVLDAGATPNGRPFFVMELVRGLEITRHCDQCQLDLKQRLELFIQVCQAVLHAHQKGIVHRDIKPDNILVCSHDGCVSPKIIDFGIAKVIHNQSLGGTPMTRGLPFLGTPAYMSPEQAQGATADLDTRTDIYSLGALLYELLVGHPPFDHQKLVAAGLDDMCRIIRSEEPHPASQRFAQLPAPEQSAIAKARATSPEQLRRDLSGDLDWICLKALEKDREQRYETAAGLAQDVRRHLVHLPVSAAAPTLPYRFKKVMRRNRKTVMTAAAFVLLLLVGTVATSIMAVHAESSARRAAKLQSMAIAAERQSHHALLEMHASSALSASEIGNYDRAVLWFATAARASGKDTPTYELNFRRALAWLARTPVPVAAFQLSSTFNVLEFSPDSQYLLGVDREGRCLIWDCAAHHQLPWPSTLGRVVAVSWHPDGTRVAVAAENKPVELRSVPDGSLLRTFAGTEDAPAVAFSLNRAILLCGGETVRAFDLVTGAALERVWPHPHTVIGFGFTASADRFVTVSKDGKARVCSLKSPDDASIVATAAHRPSIRIDSCSKKTSYRQDFLEVPVLSLPALGGLDTVLVTRTGPYGISIWETGTGRLLQALDQMCCSCRFVLSPDSTRMAAGLQGGKVGVWDVTTGSQQALLTSSGACILDLTYGPAGEWLLTAQANGVARVWSVSQDRPIYSAMHHATEVDKVAFAPNGELVATGQADGLVRLWALPKTSSRGHLISSTPGPKVMRLDPERCHFVAAREPAWKAELRTATIFNAQTGQPVGPTLEFEGNLEDVALSPKHKMAAVVFGMGDDTQPGMLEFREVHSGKLAGRMQLVCAASSLSWDPKADRVAVITHAGHLLIAAPESNTPVTWAQPAAPVPGEVHPLVAFSPDGASLISMTPAGTLEVRESVTGALRYPALRAPRGSYRFFTVSLDGRFLAATTGGGQVDVWDIAAGLRQVNPLPHPGQVYRCNFSADSTLLATACHDCKSRVWDLQSGHLAGPANLHPNEVYDAAFTPDGNWLLTACRDGAVRIWERRTGQLIAPRFIVGGQAFTVDVTADGNYAVVGSLDDRIHVLSLAALNQPLCGDVDKLCTLAEIVSGSALSQGMLRDLSSAEWLQRFRDLQQGHRILAGASWPVGCMVQNTHYVPSEPAKAAIASEESGPACSTCTNNSCPRSASSPTGETSPMRPR